MNGKEHFEKGQELFLKKKYGQCREQFGQAMEDGYDPVSGHLSMGVAFLSEGRYDEAMHQFSKVIELDRRNERAHYYRGISYMNKRDFPCAIADLNRSLGADKSRPTAFLARAIAEAEVGMEINALQDFKQALTVSKVEVEEFGNLFGSTMTSFDRTMALLHGERGPLSEVLTPDEIAKLRKWIQ